MPSAVCFQRLNKYTHFIRITVFIVGLVDSAPAWRGRLRLTLRSPFVPRHVTWLRSSPPHSE